MICERGFANNWSGLIPVTIAGSNTARVCLFSLVFDCILSHLEQFSVR